MSRSSADPSLYEGLISTRAIRRYTDEPVPDEVLRDILFAANAQSSGIQKFFQLFGTITNPIISGAAPPSKGNWSLRRLVSFRLDPLARNR